MISRTDTQSKIVAEAAADVPAEKLPVFLWRISARLQLQRGVRDIDVERATKLARIGLIHEPAA
jgi:hypothetical protein